MKKLLIGLLAPLVAHGDQSISSLTALSSGALDPAADVLPIVDISAGSAGTKKITVDNLFAGWGAVSLTGAQTLSGPKTLTSPVINVGSDATGDIYYRSSGGAFTRLAAGANGHVLTLASGLPSWAAATGTTLTHFTEAVSTAAPNATVPVVSFTATNAATDVDMALKPKGAGALTAHIADNTSTGGNKRGQYAVDLQTLRTANSQVASSSASGILSGSGNTASASFSVVSGGLSNAATSGNYGAIGGGQSNAAGSGGATHASVMGGFANSASGTYSAVLGGGSNVASGQASAVVGGESNTASGQNSWIPGGLRATTRGLYGVGAQASGRFSADGDAQRGKYLARRATTDATTTELSLDGGSPGAATRIVLPNNHAYSFRGRIVGRSSTGDVAVWNIDGLIKRGANAAATALVGTPTATMTFNDGGASAWTITITADTTNGALKIEVTGAAATTIHWLADIETVEVS